MISTKPQFRVLSCAAYLGTRALTRENKQAILLCIISTLQPRFPPSAMNAMKGGVVWTKGNLTVLDGVFRGNTGAWAGGVFYASDGSSVALLGGVLTGNWAKDGGVALADDGAELLVEGSECSGNVAVSNGGVFFSSNRGHLEVYFACTALPRELTSSPNRVVRGSHQVSAYIPYWIDARMVVCLVGDGLVLLSATDDNDGNR